MAVGLTTEDITAWIPSETGLRFSYRELPKIIGELSLWDGMNSKKGHWRKLIENGKMIGL